MEIKGKYNACNVYATIVDKETKKQIKELCDQKFTKDLNIAIMADCHAGKGCVIGTTMTLKDKIVPNLVGVDIGCGMYTYFLGNMDINYIKLDRYIRKKIPSGNYTRKEALEIDLDLSKLKCYSNLKYVDRIAKSIGTLGGGNHFIEIDVDEDNNKYLIVHTGSRNLGKQVAEYYQELARINQRNDFKRRKNNLIKRYRRKNPQALEKALARFDKRVEKYNFELAYLEGELFDNYLFDMDICQKFASINRMKLIEEILHYLEVDFKKENGFETIHNYIDIDNKILRKGSISARKEEKVLIPINMKDGSIIAMGKSNKDYNYSAPHGAGRVLTRKEAKESIKLEEFKKEMEGIYSTSVTTSTLDESPFAYKRIEDIVPNIVDTVDILKVIKPVYNFKDAIRNR